jgi:DNA-binding transcriptional ArsR family regulator
VPSRVGDELSATGEAPISSLGGSRPPFPPALTPPDASDAAAPAPGLRDPGRVFAALADPRRRELLELLADTPGASAGVLAARLPVSRQAVAQHLAVLEECALVTRKRAGRQVLFSVRPEGLKATADWLLARTAAWLGQ